VSGNTNQLVEQKLKSQAISAPFSKTPISRDQSREMGVLPFHRAATNGIRMKRIFLHEIVENDFRSEVEHNLNANSPGH
jgi:hypothetical protein